MQYVSEKRLIHLDNKKLIIEQLIYVVIKIKYYIKMSNIVPIFGYPNGSPIQIDPTDEGIIHKWVEPLGGEILPGPVTRGTIRPDGREAHGGVMTINSKGIRTIEYLRPW